MRPGGQCDLLAAESPSRIACYSVEANFLKFLGFEPAIGRDFTPQDDQPHAPPVALLSFSLWRSRFGGDAHVLGQNVTVDEEPVRIVGVLPKGFEMPQLGQADILMPERLHGPANGPRAPARSGRPATPRPEPGAWRPWSGWTAGAGRGSGPGSRGATGTRRSGSGRRRPRASADKYDPPRVFAWAVGDPYSLLLFLGGSASKTNRASKYAPFF